MLRDPPRSHNDRVRPSAMARAVQPQCHRKDPRLLFDRTHHGYTDANRVREVFPPLMIVINGQRLQYMLVAGAAYAIPDQSQKAASDNFVTGYLIAPPGRFLICTIALIRVLDAGICSLVDELMRT